MSALARARLAERLPLALVLLALVGLVTLALFGTRPFAEAADLDADAHSLPLASQPCGRSSETPAHYRHVIWIWMENHSYDQVIGGDGSPFETALSRACGLATNYHSIRHPSLPNYLAATGGSTFGFTRDRPPAAQPIDAPSIFSEVAASGRQWRTYVEAMPANCQAMGKYGFARNPAAYFTRSRSQCPAWDLPLGRSRSGAFATALRTDRLPAFSLVIPDKCHSTHGCPVTSGDAWLSHWVNRIVASRSYRNGSTAVFLTWDEGKRDLNQHIALIVVSPTTPRGAVSRARLNHYSLLRATAGLLGIRPPGRAGTARGLDRPFGL
jgi:phospholipase C